VLRNNDGAYFTGVIATASLLEADETFFLKRLDRSNSKRVSDKVFYGLP
jgi:ribonuclease HIII